MVDFVATEALPDIPTDLSIPQYFLDHHHPLQPLRPSGVPWFIEDDTGRAIHLDEVRNRTYGLANALSSVYGIGEGDVVLIFCRNHVDYPIAMWATHRLGAIVTPANPEYSSNELSYQLDATKASVILVHPEALKTAIESARSSGISLDRIVLFNVPSYPSIASHITINDLVQKGLSRDANFVEQKIDSRTKIALLSFSSGTTGRPKAVAIPHIAVITNVIQVAVHNKVNTNYTSWEQQRYRPGDVALAALPFYHIYGLVLNMHYMVFCGMAVVVVPKFNFVNFLESIVRHRITHLLLVPPQAVLLCKHPAVKNYDLSGIRMMMFGAAPLSDEVMQQLFQLLPNAQIGQAYGMTETCTAVSMWPVSQKRGTSGSAGELLPGIVARVVKPDGSLAGYNEPGELVLRTPSAALCYYNNENATKETFVNGWVRTGDEVKIDRNNELWVLDRIKEIMKVKGFQVAPAELEGCILNHPDVSDACVVGVPDDYSGEVPLAFVVLSADARRKLEESPIHSDPIKSSIMKHVAKNKIHYKHLAGGVEIVNIIPKNPSGKLLRRVLRDRAKDIVSQRPRVAKL